MRKDGLGKWVRVKMEGKDRIKDFPARVRRGECVVMGEGEGEDRVCGWK